MSRRTDQDLDRLLAGGKPAGPELDRMWQRVHERLESPDPAPAAATARGLWRWILALGVPAMAASAVAIFMLVAPDPKSEWQARGPADSAPAIEASCGTSEHPCLVGQPVFLRLVAGAEGGTLLLELQGEGSRLLGSAVLQAGADRVLPLQLVPEAADVATGIDLRLWFAPGALEAGPGAEALTLARVQASAQARSVTRRLQVSAP